MRIALVAKPGGEDTGVGRYTAQLHAALKEQGHEVIIVHPVVPLPVMLVQAAQRLLGWDLAAFFDTYAVWAWYPKADIYHVTSQNLATLLLLCRPPSPIIVTVHDIIPHIAREIKEIAPHSHIADGIFDRLAMRGLAQATLLIAVTAYVRTTLIDNLEFDSERIVVVHEGVARSHTYSIKDRK